LSIRRYEPGDFDAVTILWRVAREKSLPDFQKRKGHFFFEDRDYFQDHVLREDEVWVFEEEGSVRAFMAMRGDFIDHLYVHPDSWRRGIGRQLLEFARVLSPEHLWLYTLQVNQGAMKFYERNGFTATRFGVSPPPEDEPDVEYHWWRDGGLIK
jgi:GNAT superfamily N-acetyltransferase